MDADVIVVGHGLAGMIAAAEVAEKGEDEADPCGGAPGGLQPSLSPGARSPGKAREDRAGAKALRSPRDQNMTWSFLPPASNISSET
jgi:hypothetical protein